MPFPLAHPAAVLPLRHFGARRLSFAALVTGSIVPDIAYFADDYSRFGKVLRMVTGPFATEIPYINSKWTWSEFSHSVPGSLLFCLPIGLLIQSAFYPLRTALVATFPNPHRSALAPLCITRKRSFGVIVVSLIIGIWIHLFWDLFTHDNGPSISIWEQIQNAIGLSTAGQTALQRILWIISSMGGVAALVGAYVYFLKQNKLPLWVINSDETSRYLLWSGVLGVPALIALPLTHAFGYGIGEVGLFAFFHAFAETYLVIVSCCVLLLGLISKLTRWRLNAAPRTDV